MKFLDFLKFLRFLFRKKQKITGKIYDTNGSLYWLDYDRGTICGHKYEPEPGDGIRCKMQSGKMGLFYIKNVRWCNDPRNMYFADVEPIGYEGQS